MTQSSFIYALVDPLTDRIRYIGQTNDLERRYKEHCERIDESPKGRWVRALKSNGAIPKLIVLESVSDTSRLNYSEKWWIALGRKQGWELLNVGNPTRTRASFEELFVSALRDVYAYHDRFDKPAIVIKKITLVGAVCTLYGLLVFLCVLFSPFQVIRDDYIYGAGCAISMGYISFMIYYQNHSKWRILSVSPGILFIVSTAIAWSKLL